MAVKKKIRVVFPMLLVGLTQLAGCNVATVKEADKTHQAKETSCCRHSLCP